MVLPGAVPGPGIMKHQRRSYSEQPVLKGLAVDELMSAGHAKLALPEEKLNLKRACSFPAAAYHPPVKPAASFTSTKPSFRIQIPSIDLSNLSSAFCRHQKYRETAAAFPPQAHSGDNVLDSPIFEDHAARTNLAPLFTPPDESPAVNFTMSALNPEVIHQPQHSSTSEADKITNPNWAFERVKVGMESGEGQGESMTSKTAEPSGGCEGSGDQEAQGNDEIEDSNPHWLDSTMKATGRCALSYAALVCCTTLY
jgi:hypothetical protein